MGPVTVVHKGMAAGVLLTLAGMSLAARKRPVPETAAPAPEPEPEPARETTVIRRKPRLRETGKQ